MRKLVAAAVVAAAIAMPAAAAGADEAAPKDVRIVNLNLLHGLFCPPETEACQAEDRVALLMRQLEDADCPEVVGLQEINIVVDKELDKAVPKACDGKYSVAFRGEPGTSDTEQVLTTLPVRSKKILKLVGNFRQASRVVLESDLGLVVVVVTHQDGDPEGGPSGEPCKRCPPPCKQAQAGVFECQTVAAAALADEVGGAKALRVLMGDFNVTPTSARYEGLLADGWIDTHVEAGNSECDPATSASCTAGRDDESIESLKDPSIRQRERIDFIFVKVPERCDLAVDDPTDADGDGLGTGVWHGEPTTDGPGGIVWTSDHTGTSADVSCGGKK